MDVVTTFITCGQAAELVQPRKGALHDPPMPSKSLRRLDPAARNAGPNVAASASEPAPTKIVALIGVQFLRSSAGTTPRAPDRGHPIQHGFERHGVVDVGGRHADSEGDALAVDQDVMLAACFAAIGRVRPRR